MTLTAPSTTTTTATATAASGGPPRILQNPYAQRKPPPEIFKDPLHIDDDGGGGGGGSGAPDAVAKSQDVPYDPPSRSAASPCSSAPGPPSRAAGEEEGSSAPTIPPPPRNRRRSGGLPATRSSDVPPWERLPSRALSFSSAEIVTVFELLQQQRRHEPATPRRPAHEEEGAAPKARSVRVMGVVTHKLVHGDASVSMVLRDPLSSPPSATPQPRRSVKPPPSSIRPSKFQRPVGHPRAPSLGNVASTPAGRPGTATAAASAPSAPRPPPPTVRTAAATPAVRSMIRPQPLRSRSAPTTGGGSSITSGSVSRSLASHKRPWSAAAPLPPNPLQSLAAAAASGDDLWVVVRSGYDSVNQLVVGDLVTVIGEVHWVPSRVGGAAVASDDDDDDPASIPEAVRQVLAPHMAPRPAGEPHQEEVSPTRRAPTPSSHNVMYLLARILIASNGVNAALFVQALNARRQLLARRSCSTETS